MSQDLNTEKHNLLFGIRRSIRYHNRRTRFFDRINKVTTFFAALSGTAVFVAVIGDADQWISMTFAALVAVFSVVDLVIGTASAARMHNDFAKQYFSLEKAMILEKDVDNAKLNAFKSQRLDIEASEPPPLRVLDMICHNELCRAMKYDEKSCAKIKWYQRLFSQIMDIDDHKIKCPSYESQ